MTKETAKTAKKTKSTKTEAGQEALFEEISSVSLCAKEEPLPDNDGKVGTLLKEARLKKELKLPEISKDLCIRKAYLEAIENSNYKEIPEMPYGPGFVRSYADYLGLNSERLVQLFKEETNAKPKKTEKVLISEETAEVTAPNKKYIVFSLLAIVAVYLAWLAYNSKEAGVKEEKTQEFVEETTSSANDFPLVVEDFASLAQEETTASVEENISVIDTTQTQAVSNSQVTMTEASYEPAAEPAAISEASANVAEEKIEGIVLNINKETWVEVKDSEKLYLSKVLKAGETYTLPNKGKGMIYSVGRRGAVDVVINGKVVDVLPAGKSTNISLDKFLQH